MLRNLDKLDLEVKERLVTVMFIDVVAFSSIVENQDPREAFVQLRSLLTWLSHKINTHGGIVDKTLGDGLLCYFGHEFQANAATPANHALQAVTCALEIQNENLANIVAARDEKVPLYPLRIGINTASVIMGDIGMMQRIDFTAIGAGVNFAKRLESACDIHSVMISQSTMKALPENVMPAQGLAKRLIQVKNQVGLSEAFEFDPYHDKPIERRRAIDLCHKYAGISRHNTRWNVPPAAHFQMGSQAGA
jgi:class 3 adenylate cyclase